MESVKKLIEKSFQSEPKFESKAGILVHLARYSNDNKKIEGNEWMTCWKGGKHGLDKKALACGPERRLFGTKNVAILFVHLNIAHTAGDWRDLDSANVTYHLIAKAKLPINIQHLLSLLNLVGAGAQAAAVPQRIAIMGAGFADDVPSPSDLTAFATTKQDGKTSQLGSRLAVDNEGFYLWDVSVAVPVNKISLAEYSETNGSVSPKEVNKQSVYGLFNLYPYPVDLKKGGARYLLPRPAIGLGLTGRPGQNFFVGGAWGFPFLQFFVGSGFANTKVPVAGGAAGATVEQYKSRATYGLNIPVLSAIEKVKAAAAAKKK